MHDEGLALERDEDLVFFFFKQKTAYEIVERMLLGVRERNLFDGQRRAHRPEVGHGAVTVPQGDEYFRPREQCGGDAVMITGFLAERERLVRERERLVRTAFARPKDGEDAQHRVRGTSDAV